MDPNVFIHESSTVSSNSLQPSPAEDNLSSSWHSLFSSKSRSPNHQSRTNSYFHPSNNRGSPPNADQVYNIIAFGETGVGKSSLITMVCRPNQTLPVVSGEADASTTDTAEYWITAENASPAIKIWDTPGLLDGGDGAVETVQALHAIHRLVEDLSHKNQTVNLLIYCIRASRYRSILRANYDLVAKLICDGNVPVVLAINGLENEGNMDDWWKRNQKRFEKHMKFQDHVCMTTTKGKWDGSRFVFQDEYEVSREKAKAVIQTNFLTNPWPIIDFASFHAFDEKRKQYMERYNSRTEKERNLVNQFVRRLRSLGSQNKP